MRQIMMYLEERIDLKPHNYCILIWFPLTDSKMPMSFKVSFPIKEIGSTENWQLKTSCWINHASREVCALLTHPDRSVFEQSTH